MVGCIVLFADSGLYLTDLLIAIAALTFYSTKSFFKSLSFLHTILSSHVLNQQCLVQCLN